MKTRAKRYSVETSAKMCEAYKAYFGTAPDRNQSPSEEQVYQSQRAMKTL